MPVYHKQGSDGSLEVLSTKDHVTKASGGVLAVPVLFDKDGWCSVTTDRRLFIADRPYVVKAISAICDTAEGGALTATFYKVSDHTATVGAGTSLHASGSINLNSAAATRQNASLATAVTTVTLDEGDAVGVVLSATAATAVAVASIVLAPK